MNNFLKYFKFYLKLFNFKMKTRVIQESQYNTKLPINTNIIANI